ncbi:aldo/keto reductase [Actinomyces sp. 2119]|uniref:aldo/keto reductase n=1 Tax=Actinomyces sp. 2119 TaxID=2321393 RepID=UPI000E6C5A3A|nr:aldo/keto reductase [Actinomyces sp. 2119]RJF44080.1 aldo/keto reductase [Actinomyces sp. 2119]
MTGLPADLIPLTHGISPAGPSTPPMIPQLGLGTYKVVDDDAEHVVLAALELGYRHIDTAQMYGNEAGVGRALAASRLQREELFVTSKLDNPNHRRDDALRSLDATLDALGLDFLDLFLVHWPLAMSAGIDLVDTWRTMIKILDSGRVRAIGVSNYTAEHLHRITEATGVVPAVNQVELHPWLTQESLRSIHERLGIVTQSWSPLGRGQVLQDPVVVQIAQDLKVSPAQVVIRWHLQKGFVVIPKSVHSDRIRTNGDVFGFTLTQEQVAAIDALDRGQRTGSHPDRVQV